MKILKEGSYVNGLVFLPMLESDITESFKSDKQFLYFWVIIFRDPDGPISLSEKQKMSFGSWKRPHEIFGENKPQLLISISR